MIIVKDKSNNSQLCIARSNAALDTAIFEEEKVYITEDMLYEILRNYTRNNEFEHHLEQKQDTLVSGKNIKTINGDSILGIGNIEAAKQQKLTQAEYDELWKNGEVEEDKLYLITDAPVTVPFLYPNDMVEYVDDVVGQINKILEDIIG